jgi:hypothetical protein
VIERGRLDRAKSDWFHVRMAFGQKIVSPDLGIFARNVIG